jgi:hypothetical protein
MARYVMDYKSNKKTFRLSLSIMNYEYDLKINIATSGYENL